jgi:hypothetical protein
MILNNREQNFDHGYNDKFGKDFWENAIAVGRI